MVDLLIAATTRITHDCKLLGALPTQHGLSTVNLGSAVCWGSELINQVLAAGET